MQMGWVRTHVLKRSNTQAKAHALALRSVLLQADTTMALQGGPARTWKREKHGHERKYADKCVQILQPIRHLREIQQLA